MFSLTIGACFIVHDNCTVQKVQKVTPYLDLIMSIALVIIAAYGFGLSVPAAYALTGVACVEFLFALGKIYTSCKENYIQQKNIKEP